MIAYKYLPVLIILDFLSREASREHYTDGTEFHIGKTELVANTDVYVYSPFHRFVKGSDLSELLLKSPAIFPGIVVCVTDTGQAIDVDTLYRLECQTRLARAYRLGASMGPDQYFERNLHLTCIAAVQSVEVGVNFVGIDSYNIDDTEGGSCLAHSRLLFVSIPICEHMCNLMSLADSGFRIHALPIKIKECGTFPIREYAVLGL